MISWFSLSLVSQQTTIGVSVFVFVSIFGVSVFVFVIVAFASLVVHVVCVVFVVVFVAVVVVAAASATVAVVVAFAFAAALASVGQVACSAGSPGYRLWARSPEHLPRVSVPRAPHPVLRRLAARSSWQWDRKQQPIQRGLLLLRAGVFRGGVGVELCLVPWWGLRLVVRSFGANALMAWRRTQCCFHTKWFSSLRFCCQPEYFNSAGKANTMAKHSS